MNASPNVYNETKEFPDFQEAALHVKSVFDRTKTDKNIKSGEVTCQFRGRIFKGVKINQEIKVLFNHDYLEKMAAAVPQSTFDFLKAFGEGEDVYFEIEGAENKEFYEIKLTSSTVMKPEMDDFNERLKRLGLNVSVVAYPTLTAHNYKTADDLIPEGLSHYFQ